MKKIMIMLVFVLSAFWLAASTDDTTKFTISPQDPTRAIVMELKHCFVDADFMGLAPMCNGSLTFVFRRDTANIMREYASNYKIVTNLNAITKIVPYTRFVIFCWEDSACETVLTVQVFRYDEIDDEYILFHFVLDNRLYIKRVTIE